ncbi:putative membrane protein YuaF [Sporomusa ovata DSM 2662]|uniref:Putative membrane protein n=1 Tax=Sporomusa ovata TaxID=2378 RepID=A0A0U1KZP1_9FIRM|nr:NfeD family protein [Sporomusa ovata]EQB27804.1 NfeD-like C-terminal, partner-binding [Sporomusa ovata DSM 2662]CQR72735.1 putative membrane protein [Sporomusa ovata]
MLELYWGCLIFGVIFATVTILFGDLLDSHLDGFFHVFPLEHLEWLQPMVIIGGITIFGGMGLTLTRYTELAFSWVILFSLFTAILLSMLIYFLYIKPMRNCENSVGFFIRDLIGRTGEVTVPIPVSGYGEVLIKIGAGNTNQIAANYDNAELFVGTQVIVIDVRENVLYVSNCTEQNKGGVS